MFIVMLQGVIEFVCFQHPVAPYEHYPQTTVAVGGRTSYVDTSQDDQIEDDFNWDKLI